MNLNFNVGGLNMFGESSGARLWLSLLVHAAFPPSDSDSLVSAAHGAEVSLVRLVARLWRQRDG